MSLHSPRPWLRERHGPNNLFAATATKSLSSLHRSTASIAEHDCLSSGFNSFPLQIYADSLQQFRLPQCHLHLENLEAGNEKATRQQGGLFSRENSSNGGM